jgi:hypothetical protein
MIHFRNSKIPSLLSLLSKTTINITNHPIIMAAEGILVVDYMIFFISFILELEAWLKW